MGRMQFVIEPFRRTLRIVGRGSKHGLPKVRCLWHPKKVHAPDTLLNSLPVSPDLVTLFSLIALLRSSRIAKRLRVTRNSQLREYSCHWSLRKISHSLFSPQDMKQRPHLVYFDFSPVHEEERNDTECSGCRPRIECTCWASSGIDVSMRATVRCCH